MSGRATEEASSVWQVNMRMVRLLSFIMVYDRLDQRVGGNEENSEVDIIFLLLTMYSQLYSNHWNAGCFLHDCFPNRIGKWYLSWQKILKLGELE